MKLVLTPFLCLTLLFISNLTFSQKDAEDMWVDYIYHSITVETDSSKIKAHIVDESIDEKIDDEIYYYSYNHRKISRIRGGVVGKVLHGDYTEIGFDGNMIQFGKLFLGQKDGPWKEWYRNGELKTLVNYRKGEKEGVFKVYSIDGYLLKKGTYKNNLLDGKVYTYLKDESVSIEKYNKGVKKEEKPKKEKKQKKEKKPKKVKKEKTPKLPKKAKVETTIETTE